MENGFQNIFIDPIVSTRKKRRRREVDMKRERKKERDVSASTPSSVTDDGVDAETSLSFFLSLFMSTSLLRLFFSCSLLGQFLVLTIGSINIF